MNQCTNCMWSLSLSPIGRRWTSLSRTECLSCCLRWNPRPRVLSALPLNQPRANRYIATYLYIVYLANLKHPILLCPITVGYLCNYYFHSLRWEPFARWEWGNYCIIHKSLFSSKSRNVSLKTHDTFPLSGLSVKQTLLLSPFLCRHFEESVRLCLRVSADCFDSRLTRRSPYLLLTPTHSRSGYSSQLTAPLVYDVVLKTSPWLWLSQYSAKTQARPFPGQSHYTHCHMYCHFTLLPS